MDKKVPIVYDVDMAKDLKAFISVTKDVKFYDPNLKDKIWDIPDYDLVRVGKSFSSVKIISVDVIDDTFLSAIFK